LAVLVVLVQTIGTTLDHWSTAPLPLPAYALLALGGLVLARRFRSPGFAVVVSAATTVAYGLLHYPGGVMALFALVAAMMSAIRAGRHKLAWTSALAAYLVWIIGSHASLHHGVVLAAQGFALGLLLEIVAAILPMLGEQVKEQERLSAEKGLRQASEERLRIAQELHDVVGHHLSLINVRASVGLHLMDRQPEQARTALETIKQASAEALSDVQYVLNALEPGDQAAPRAPAPGLARLDELTADPGLAVRTVITGRVRALPAKVDLAAYRIVQEALTNVRRHAGPGATADIVVSYGDDGVLTVQVDDDGGGHLSFMPFHSAGNGIGGMRERAKLLGGELTAGPQPGGGWRVAARIPLPAEPEHESQAVSDALPCPDSDSDSVPTQDAA
jgi:signal transduction histidine kinase